MTGGNEPTTSLADVAPNDGVDAPSRLHRPAVRWWRAGLAISVLVGVVLVAPRWGADLRAVGPTLTELTWPHIALLTVAAAWNTVSYWFLLAAALPGLGLARAALSNQAGTAVSSTALGGGAVSATLTLDMYRSWDFSTGQFAVAASISGAWTLLVKLAVPPAVLVVLHPAHGGHGLLVDSAWVGSALFGIGVVLAVVLLIREECVRRLGEGTGRAAAAAARRFGHQHVGGTWGATAVAARASALHLLRTRWRPLTATAVVSHLSLFVVLLLSLRVVGVTEEQLPWTHVLAAFAFVELLSAIPITPGALGVAELGYAAALLPGLDPGTGGRVAAAVLLYRAVTYLPPIPIALRPPTPTGSCSIPSVREGSNWMPHRCINCNKPGGCPGQAQIISRETAPHATSREPKPW